MHHFKEPQKEKESEKKTTEDPTKESEVEKKETSETKQVEEKVSLHSVTTTKWRVENSWGDDKGDKGYLMMSDEWWVTCLTTSASTFPCLTTSASTFRL